MVAFHFPPLAGSSGIQRTLRFVQQLPALGWTPQVLTAREMAYESTYHDSDDALPRAVVVERALAFDAARHLAIGGRYIGALALPDRWASWRWDAVRRGMQMIRRLRPQVLWSTYPIATAHLIAAELHRRSGLPWVADFRDPMAQDDYPADPRTWQRFAQIERHTVNHASRCIFATPGAARVYRQRYPEAAARISVIENGYDEASFAALPAASRPLDTNSLTLLHSGIIYPKERDPTALFAALGRLRQRGELVRRPFTLRLRAPVHEAMLREMAERFGVADLIDIRAALPYRQALTEMVAADALLVLQAADCNEQIPAKTYEYLRAGRPLLALTDPAGDTAALLRRAGVSTIAKLDDVAGIERLLMSLLLCEPWGQQQPGAEVVASLCRSRRSAELAACLDRLVADHPHTTAAAVVQT